MILDLLTSQPQSKKILAEKARTSTREVELAVQAARLEGHAILSNADGYWLSQDPAEIRKCAQRLRSRALTQMNTAAALNRAADEMPLTLGLSA